MSDRLHDALRVLSGRLRLVLVSLLLVLGVKVAAAALDAAHEGAASPAAARISLNQQP